MAATTAADRGVPDDMETGGHLGLGTCPHMRLDDVGVQVAGAGAVRRIGVRLMQPGGARPECPVDEQITGQPAGSGLPSISARACAAVVTASPQ